jgi:multiple sugar transport system substrate-binding protein
VFQWLPTLWQAGGDLTDLTTPAAQKALQFWVDLMNDGSVSREALAWDQSQVGTEFAQRRAAMMIFVLFQRFIASGLTAGSVKD